MNEPLLIILLIIPPFVFLTLATMSDEQWLWKMKSSVVPSCFYKPVHRKVLGKCWPLKVSGLPKFSVPPKPLPSQSWEVGSVLPDPLSSLSSRIFATTVSRVPTSSKGHRLLQHIPHWWGQKLKQSLCATGKVKPTSGRRTTAKAPDATVIEGQGRS